MQEVASRKAEQRHEHEQRNAGDEPYQAARVPQMHEEDRAPQHFRGRDPEIHDTVPRAKSQPRAARRRREEELQREPHPQPGGAASSADAATPAATVVREAGIVERRVRHENRGQPVVPMVAKIGRPSPGRRREAGTIRIPFNVIAVLQRGYTGFKRVGECFAAHAILYSASASPAGRQVTRHQRASARSAARGSASIEREKQKPRHLPGLKIDLGQSEPGETGVTPTRSSQAVCRRCRTPHG